MPNEALMRFNEVRESQGDIPKGGIACRYRPKMRVVMILTIAAQAQNFGIDPNQLVISGVKSFLARSAKKCKINTVWLPTKNKFDVFCNYEKSGVYLEATIFGGATV